MPAFKVHHLRRLAPAKVLGSVPAAMLHNTPFDIVGDPGVQRIIGTANHVDVPVHGTNRVSPGCRRHGDHVPGVVPVQDVSRNGVHDACAGAVRAVQSV